MRVSLRELRAIRAEGLLTTFAILGPVAYISVEVPAAGSAGTSLEQPTENAAWGFVLRGEITLHGETERRFAVGTAFHVPAGSPPHWFTATGHAVVAGFAPLPGEVDTSDDALRARGFEPLDGAEPAPALPSIVVPADEGAMLHGHGMVEAEVAQMGDWTFMRTMYGPLSGYASGWCDLAHWGLVLSGDLAIRGEDGSVELLSAGDVYYCPPGAPGHQFQVPDAATTIDYTPVAQLRAGGRKAEWRALGVKARGRTGGGAGRPARPRAGSTPASSSQATPAEPDPAHPTQRASLADAIAPPPGWFAGARAGMRALSRRGGPQWVVATSPAGRGRAR